MRRLAPIFALLLVCYAYVLPRWSDWNQNSRLNLVLAMVDDHTVAIDRYVANTGDYAIYKGRAFTDKPPGLSFLALPGYMLLSSALDYPPVRNRLAALGGGGAFASTLNEQGSGIRDDKLRFALAQYLLTLLAVATPAAALGTLIFRALERLGLGPAPATAGALAYGLATTAAPYSGNFYSHQTAAALLFGAFYVSWPADGAAGPRRPGPSGLLCGLLLGWAVITEYPIAPAAALIALYALWHSRSRLIPLLVGGIIPGALLIIYDLTAFGTPLPVGYAHSALWQDQHSIGFMSLTYPRVEALWGLTLGAFRGLFVRAPWLLLAVPGYIVLWRSRQLRAELWVLLLVPLATLIFYSSSAMWWGGFAAGPRYIAPMIPFLALPAAWWAGQLWDRAGARYAYLSLVAASALLVWGEAVAGQLFPTDSIRDTWGGYVLPTWASGDIARNLGMALGLAGPASLIPLALVIAVGSAILLATRPAYGIGRAQADADLKLPLA